MNLMEIAESSKPFVADGGKIYPFFANNIPENYVISNTEYTEINLATFLNQRGIVSPTLSSLAAYLPDGAVIAGGFMISALHPEHVTTDIDIFFLGSDAFLSTYDQLCNPPDLAEAWAWKGYKTETSRGALLAHSNELRTVTFTNSDPNKLPIQLIKMVWFSQPKDVIDSFDFTVCQFSATRDQLIFNPVSWVDLQNKELIAHRWQYPIETLYRILKYTKKGYKTSHRTLIDACQSIRDAKEIQSALPVNPANYT
jgi:hypothetical protein